MKRKKFSDLKKVLLQKEVDVLVACAVARQEDLTDDIFTLIQDMGRVESLDELVGFFDQRGYNSEQAYRIILNVLVDVAK